jgi:hypothetical protein
MYFGILQLIFQEMNTNLKREKDGSLTLSVNVKFSGSCLEQEESLAIALNELGLCCTAEILESFDVLATKIEVNGENYSSKGKKKKSINAPTIR